MFHSLVDNVDFEHRTGSYPQLNRMRFLAPNHTGLGNGNCSNFRKLSNYDVRRSDDCNQTNFNADQLIFTLFDALKNPDTDKVDPAEVIDMIVRAGIEVTDPRITQFVSNVSVSAGVLRDASGSWSPKTKKKTSAIFLDREMFAQ
ncbi:hypothetical protein Ciccas_008183 [Cichlidogyrus casuarinus]|uniref:Glutaminase EF-hand domain-containing protein n=1 Tax=Cichlidogyrus casuarinus TaxID=1844966 RepID=A0ABD2Q1H7_9PLAT